MKKALFFVIPALSLVLLACDQPKPEPKQDRVSMEDSTPSRNTNYQANQDSDRLLVQRIRQTLSNDYTLSSNAKNIQVTAVNGTVTMEGSVNSQREKAMIANKIRQMNGVNDIQNRLEVTNQARG